LELPNGEVFYFFMGEEEAEKVFGKSSGEKVSVTYEIRQYWCEHDDYCRRSEVFVSGKVLSIPCAVKEK